MRSLSLRKLRTRGILFICIGLAATGVACSKAKKPTGTVTGKVTISGQPLTKGSITFLSDNGLEAAGAEIKSDGSYALKYGNSFAVPIGDYRVSISGTQANAPAPDPNDLMKNPEKYASKDSIPEKYQNPATSGLVAVIQTGSNPDTDFNLK